VPCGIAGTIAAFEAGTQAAPSKLSLSHTDNSKSLTVSWTAGVGNGTCLLQYQKTSTTWTSLAAPVDCDSDANALAATLPGNGWVSSWAAPVPLRLVRQYDGAVLGTFPQTLNCTSEPGSYQVATPTVDEDCNGQWDNATYASYAWTSISTLASGTYTACNDSTIASSSTCSAADLNAVRYTDGTSTANSPSTIWSSADLGTAPTCPGSDTGYVQWYCDGSAWLQWSTQSAPYTACTNGVTSTALACTSANVATYAYTDGTSTASDPSATWSSNTSGEGATCSGDFTGAVEWKCEGVNPTYY
jgi:hypothetical protein